MTKKINQLDVEGFEAYTPNCQFDLESPDFVSAAAKFDLDCLDALLSVKLDCITQSFWSPKNARDGVLQTEGNFLTSLCARKEGFSRQRCGALTRKGTTCLCKPLAASFTAELLQARGPPRAANASQRHKDSDALHGEKQKC